MKNLFVIIEYDAAVAELVDAHVSGTCVREDVGVRLPPAALIDTMIYVYAIKSLSRQYIYIGLTNNLDRRIQEHNKGYKNIGIFLPDKPLYQYFLRRYRAH